MPQNGGFYMQEVFVVFTLFELLREESGSAPMGGSLQLADRCDLWLLGRLVSEKGIFCLQEKVSLGGAGSMFVYRWLSLFLCCSFCPKSVGLCEYYFVVAKRDFSCWTTTASIGHTRQESSPSCAKCGSILTRIMSQVCGFATQAEVGPLKGFQMRTTKMVPSLETMSSEKKVKIYCLVLRILRPPLSHCLIKGHCSNRW